MGVGMQLTKLLLTFVGCCDCACWMTEEVLDDCCGAAESCH